MELSFDRSAVTFEELQIILLIFHGRVAYRYWCGWVSHLRPAEPLLPTIRSSQQESKTILGRKCLGYMEHKCHADKRPAVVSGSAPLRSNCLRTGILSSTNSASCGINTFDIPGFILKLERVRGRLVFSKTSSKRRTMQSVHRSCWHPDKFQC